MQYLALLSTLLPTALAATYTQSDNYVGTSFLSQWVHEAIADPTHGRVNYVDQNTAVSQNLTFASGNTLVLRADDRTTLSPSGPGRNSVRIRSNKAYSTHVVVLDAPHLPQGCGTWPAFWETTESNWPNGGEVDIIEGVNDQGPDSITLHTAAGCTMPASRGPMSGTPGSNDCEGNTGCGVSATGTANSYGPSFNSIGGGWYAMERNNNFIKVWFWPRNGNVPSDVRSGGSTVNTDSWGTPVAFFPNTQCNLSQFFAPNNIIINLTFCGDWAGNVYGSSGCPSTCVDYVNNNPSAFVNAYWQINAVRVYENPQGSSTVPSGPSGPSSQATGIHPNGNTAKCLDVQSAAFANGTPVQIYDCNGTGAQNWVISNGAIQVAGTNFCLDAGSSPANGVKMKISTCSSSTAQSWTHTSNNQIQLGSTGQCLDDTDGTTADGTITQTWACSNGDANQVWTLS